MIAWVSDAAPFRGPMPSAPKNPVRILVLLSLIALMFFSATAWAKETALTTILSGLERVQKLQGMDTRKKYELEARGTRITGYPDDFLRRRTPAEILESGLSCGCGDYASAFYSLIESQGLQVIYIDAVALNYSAIEGGDSGHTGVAVKDKESGNWILVDPTDDKILSGNWDPASTLYESPAGRFWIGYKGPLDKYLVRSHSELRTFYADTLSVEPLLNALRQCRPFVGAEGMARLNSRLWIVQEIAIAHGHSGFALASQGRLVAFPLRVVVGEVGERKFILTPKFFPGPSEGRAIRFRKGLFSHLRR